MNHATVTAIPPLVTLLLAIVQTVHTIQMDHTVTVVPWDLPVPHVVVAQVSVYHVLVPSRTRVLPQTVEWRRDKLCVCRVLRGMKGTDVNGKLA